VGGPADVRRVKYTHSHRQAKIPTGTGEEGEHTTARRWGGLDSTMHYFCLQI